MNYKDFKITRLSFLALFAVACVFGFNSCSKKDNTYRDYVNTSGTFDGNALQYLQSHPGVFDSMLLVINRLKDMPQLISTEEITLFAVSNRSFTLALQNINQARRDSIPAMPPVSLSQIDSSTLDRFFSRYILDAKVHTDSLEGFTDGRLFPSSRYNYNMQTQLSTTNASGFLDGGPKAITFSDPKNSIFTRNWIRVNTITVNIKSTNAIIHLLPPGHDFGFGREFVRLVNSR
jgi:hypothetical protein